MAANRLAKNITRASRQRHRPIRAFPLIRSPDAPTESTLQDSPPRRSTVRETRAIDGFRFYAFAHSYVVAPAARQRLTTYCNAQCVHARSKAPLAHGPSLCNRAHSAATTNESCVQTPATGARHVANRFPLPRAAAACTTDASPAREHADVRTDSYGNWQLPERHRRPTLVTARGPTRAGASSNVVSPKKDSR